MTTLHNKTHLPIKYEWFPKTANFGMMFDVDKFGIAYRNIVSHTMFKEKLEYVYDHYKKLGFEFQFSQTNERLTVKIIAPGLKWWRIVRYYPWVHWTVSKHRLEELRGEYVNKTGNFLPTVSRTEKPTVEEEADNILENLKKEIANA